jgi:hypothetical protein
MAVVKKKRGRPSKKESNQIEEEIKSEPEPKVIETIREVYVVEKAPEAIEEPKEPEDPLELKFKELGIPKAFRDDMDAMCRAKGAILEYDHVSGYLSVKKAHIREGIVLGGGVSKSFIRRWLSDFIGRRKF